MTRTRRRRRRARTVGALAACIALAGCAVPSGPAATGASAGAVEQVAELALSLRGTPYEFGGEGPGGFDCSGLVHYAYARAGLEAPRTARAQYEAVRPLYLHQLIPGDLVFFRTSGAFVSHVGIYVGGQRFVHALNPGAPVKVSRLDARYWSQRLVRAGSLAR
jgi:cell wall-associated NlpC family hydrolase